MEARGSGSVTEWVVEEDARLILLSPPPGAVCERSISSCRGDGTRPGAMDGVFPPLAPSQGCEQETTSAEDDGATARGRAPECVFPPPLAPSQGCEQGTTMAVPRRYDGDEQTAGVL